ncbi:MAG: NUDIX hydrolase [Tissierellia bacterium]|nr:NUDIX hydrolase [Tissierellia bacterium]
MRVEENVEKTVKTECAFEGKLLNVRVDTVELHDKRYARREIIIHRGAVAVIPITFKGNVVLVKQYRKAVESFMLEVPAGLREVNEEPRMTAIRELKEETGFNTGKLDFLTEIFPSPGYCTEKIHIFLAKDLIEGNQDLDEDESIELLEMPLEEALQQIKIGKISDAKTIIALLYYSQFCERS